MLFPHYRNLQPSRPEPLRRSTYRLLHLLGFARNPLGQINGHPRVANRWYRPGRIDDPDLAAHRPFSGSDLAHCGVSFLGPVNADNDARRRSGFDNSTTPYAHRTAGFIDHLLGDAPKKYTPYRRAAVRPDHDQIRAPFIGFGDDLAPRRSNASLSHNFPTGEDRLNSRARSPG